MVILHDKIGQKGETKMKKTIIVFLVIISLLMSYSIAYAAETDTATETKAAGSSQKIEIAFKVGDDVLKINGKEVQVEKPFVTNGTTLVPLRVITEAFGAEVIWNESDQSITLKYSDVIIKLTINSKEAYVDAKMTTILEAPVIVNDKTMVPLRFITENFGADVKYDDKTEQITVVKEVAGGNSIKD